MHLFITQLGYNSNEFSGYVHLRTDAVIEVILDTDKTCYIPLEYEASQKEKSRYAKKLSDYNEVSNTSLILWICKNEQIKNCLAKTDKELIKENKPTLYFALLDNVQNSEGAVRFENANGKIIVID